MRPVHRDRGAAFYNSVVPLMLNNRMLTDRIDAERDLVPNTPSIDLDQPRPTVE